MPLTPPNLDDRTFEQLVLEARARVVSSCPEWSDLSAHDPGMVLLELFAHLTETMIYRLNRLPDKAYVELLRLIGVQQQPPAAASAELTFRLDRPRPAPVEIPRGTRVSSARSESGGAPVVFVTADAARIEPNKEATSVLAWHAEPVDAELLGSATGLPGLSFRLKRAPVVARTRDVLDLVVGVEAAPNELGDRAPARTHEAKHYRVWREVEGFTQYGADPHVFVADRLAGTIVFAPAIQRLSNDGTLAANAEALAAVPPLGREIRAWYRRGGGPEGNVAAGSLKVLKDPVPGASLTVSNAEPAVGGRAAESMDNALARGPEEIHSLRRAITAHDFEALALRTASGMARARAFTQAQLWTHAPPGTVEVLLVPELPAALRGSDDRGVSAEALRSHQTEPARKRIQDELDDRRPLGTTCLVNFARYKTVSVHAKVVAHRAEDAEAMKKRIESRLYQTISPLPKQGTLPGAEQGRGWRFGQALRASNVYDVILAEPGVSYGDQVRLIVNEVPGAVKALAFDTASPRPLYAGSGGYVFRSLNLAEGWEPAGNFGNEDVDVLKVHPSRPGLLAVASRLPGGKQSKVRISWDCAESWDAATQTLDAVEDLAWTLRDGVPVLLLATGVGLFELAMQPGARPLPVVVDKADQNLGFYAVAASTDFRGSSSVAVAAMQSRGVYLSVSGGRRESFRHVGLKDKDVRTLEMQHDGPRTFLWAAMFAASGAEVGTGCSAIELLGGADAPGGWQAFDRNWEGGSCLGLAFKGSTVYAATHRAGVLWCDSSKPDVQWRRPELACGLPPRTNERLFHPVLAVTSTGEGALFAGGPEGLFRTQDAQQYKPCAEREFVEKVTLLPTWLFCSGNHQIEVVHDETPGD